MFRRMFGMGIAIALVAGDGRGRDDEYGDSDGNGCRAER